MPTKYSRNQTRRHDAPLLRVFGEPARALVTASAVLMLGVFMSGPGVALADSAGTITTYGGKQYDLATDAGRAQLMSDCSHNLVECGPGGAKVLRILAQQPPSQTSTPPPASVQPNKHGGGNITGSTPQTGSVSSAASNPDTHGAGASGQPGNSTQTCHINPAGPHGGQPLPDWTDVLRGKATVPYNPLLVCDSSSGATSENSQPGLTTCQQLERANPGLFDGRCVGD
jgi:hypothetical protein